MLHNVAIYTNSSASTALFRGQFVQGPGTATYHVGDTPQHANLIKLSGNFLFASLIVRSSVDRSSRSTQRLTFSASPLLSYS